ncbi:uncharacterized protein H6S33_003181 [Morchella sextelata]|uniref:uncharacterized protein n=1 Tax=Morchella sextelata TaxID=1174677 RepID=UPI001D04B5B7|nr:uncharacterized protein H6S33_003181 [Morchella sextelata]KAH0607193.1 hypothetical protein H6S33_003181 [Morchella sextelata]
MNNGQHPLKASLQGTHRNLAPLLTGLPPSISSFLKRNLKGGAQDISATPCGMCRVYLWPSFPWFIIRQYDPVIKGHHIF